MSFIEAVDSAAVHAMQGTRWGARVLGHPIEVLDQVHQGLRPSRMRAWQDRSQQFGQQIGTGPMQSGSAENSDVSGSPIEGSPTVEEAGILDFLGGAVEWLRDL